MPGLSAGSNFNCPQPHGPVTGRATSEDNHMPSRHGPNPIDSSRRSDKDIDIERTRWDLEYRALVKAYLNRCSGESIRKECRPPSDPRPVRLASEQKIQRFPIEKVRRAASPVWCDKKRSSR